MNKQDLILEVYRQDEGGFFTLNLEVKPVSYINGDVLDADYDNRLTLRYQAHNHTQGADYGWYAGRKFTLTGLDIDKASQLLFLAKWLDLPSFDSNPLGLYTKLVRKAPHYIRDQRQGGFVFQENVLPPEYSRWVDDTYSYQAGKSGITVSCLETNYEDATRLLDAQFQYKISNGPEWSRNTDSVVYSNWVLAGRPVRRIDHEKYPDTRTFAELLEYEW